MSDPAQIERMLCPPSRSVSKATLRVNVHLILINPRVTAKSKSQNVIANHPVIAKSNLPKRKTFWKRSDSTVLPKIRKTLALWRRTWSSRASGASTTGQYYYWLRQLEFQLTVADTLNYGGSGSHPGGGGGEGGFLL